MMFDGRQGMNTPGVQAFIVRTHYYLVAGLVEDIEALDYPQKDVLKKSLINASV